MFLYLSGSNQRGVFLEKLSPRRGVTPPPTHSDSRVERQQPTERELEGGKKRHLLKFFFFKHSSSTAKFWIYFKAKFCGRKKSLMRGQSVIWPHVTFSCTAHSRTHLSFPPTFSFWLTGKRFQTSTGMYSCENKVFGRDSSSDMATAVRLPHHVRNTPTFVWDSDLIHGDPIPFRWMNQSYPHPCWCNIKGWLIVENHPMPVIQMEQRQNLAFS